MVIKLLWLLVLKICFEKLATMGVGVKFAASKGWIWRFCKCHGIRELSLQEGKLSADSTGIDPFKKTLQEVML